MEKRDVMNFIESFRQNSGWNMVPEEKPSGRTLQGLRCSTRPLAELLQPETRISPA